MPTFFRVGIGLYKSLTLNLALKLSQIAFIAVDHYFDGLHIDGAVCNELPDTSGHFLSHGFSRWLNDTSHDTGANGRQANGAHPLLLGLVEASPNNVVQGPLEVVYHKDDVGERTGVVRASSEHGLPVDQRRLSSRLPVKGIAGNAHNRIINAAEPHAA